MRAEGEKAAFWSTVAYPHQYVRVEGVKVDEERVKEHFLFGTLLTKTFGLVLCAPVYSDFPLSPSSELDCMRIHSVHRRSVLAINMWHRGLAAISLVSH